MPMIGPLTTPPMTIAASNIPGRYLEILSTRALLYEAPSLPKDVQVYFIVCKPDDKGDAKGESAKE